MTKLAITGEPEFELCRIEELRPGPSYTVDTLARLSVLYPGAALHLILGSDQYREISGWCRPQMLARLARLVVMSRPGTAQPALFPGHDPRRVLFRAVIQIAVSAKLVRARLAKAHSVRYMLPVRVNEYVTRHHLYERKVKVKVKAKTRAASTSTSTFTFSS
jgi:nicotinate-nucleotide adenylyltransferase